MNAYFGYYDRQRVELTAETSYAAQQATVKHFKVPKSKSHMAHVMLIRTGDGKEVQHATGSL